MTRYETQLRRYDRGECDIISYKRYKYKGGKHNSKMNERDMTGYEKTGKKKNAASHHTRDANISESRRVSKKKGNQYDFHHIIVNYVKLVLHI